MVLWTCNDPLPQKQSESFWPTSHLWLFPTGVVWSAGLGETAAGAAWRRLSASWSRPGSPPASDLDADFLSLPCPFSVLPFHKEYDSTCFSIRLKKKKIIKKNRPVFLAASKLLHVFCKITDQVSLTEEQVWNGNDMNPLPLDSTVGRGHDKAM